MIDQATNFWGVRVWDGQKYKMYFRLSETPVYARKWPVLKIDLKIVHQWISRNRVQNPPERRGPAVIFTGFSEKISKNGLFMAWRAYIRPGPLKMVFLADFTQNR